jgi:hypothetical protein
MVVSSPSQPLSCQQLASIARRVKRWQMNSPLHRNRSRLQLRSIQKGGYSASL